MMFATTTKAPRSLFFGLVALGAVLFTAMAPAEANRVPPRPLPEPVPPRVEREPADRSYIFDGLTEYDGTTFVLLHRRTVPRSERVDEKTQVVANGKAVKLHFTEADQAHRGSTTTVKLHAVTKALPEKPSGTWLGENAVATLDCTADLPATTMFMNQDIRSEKLTYRVVMTTARNGSKSLRMFRSRAERYDKDGNVIFARDYADPQRPLHEQRRAEKGGSSADYTEPSATSFGGAGVLWLVLISSFAAFALLGFARLRRDG